MADAVLNHNGDLFQQVLWKHVVLFFLVHIVSGSAVEVSTGTCSIERLRVLGKVAAEDQKAVSAENADRRVVIQGMAEAILTISGQPVDPKHLNDVRPQAAETFAKIRRDRAKKGWWVQQPDGDWTRK